MQTISRIETVDAQGYIHFQFEKAPSVKVRIIIEDIDNNSSHVTIPSESFALARLQEQSSFVKNVIGSAAEGVWNDL
jgi:hypothetical protein